jgi:hypothetical protein
LACGGPASPLKVNPLTEIIGATKPRPCKRPSHRLQGFVASAGNESPKVVRQCVSLQKLRQSSEH